MATKKATKKNGKTAANYGCANCGVPLRPTYIPGESAEEREKRLAAKKALTLKAFQLTYEAHQRRRKAP